MTELGVLHISVVIVESSEFAIVFSTPDQRSAVIQGGHDVLGVRTVGRTQDCRPIRIQRGDHEAEIIPGRLFDTAVSNQHSVYLGLGSNIPDTDDSCVGRRQQVPPIGAELCTVHIVCMTTDQPRFEGLLVIQFPQPDRQIVRPGGNAVTDRVENCTVDRVLVPSELLHLEWVVKVPD